MEECWKDKEEERRRMREEGGGRVSGEEESGEMWAEGAGDRRGSSD